MASAKNGKSKTYVDRKPVKGGWIVRESATGRLVSVTTQRSTSFPSEMTREVIGGASTKRSRALERLVNR